MPNSSLLLLNSVPQGKICELTFQTLALRQSGLISSHIFLSHFRGLSLHLVSNHDIIVAQKPHRTIGNLFPKPKDPVPKDQTRGAIYSIPCKDCDKSYIGETKRKFSARLKEHQKAVEHKHSQKSALAEHCLRSGHTVSWEASKILRTNANWRNRRILEAWEINTSRNPLNRDDGMHLPHEFLNLALRDRIQ